MAASIADAILLLQMLLILLPVLAALYQFSLRTMRRDDVDAQRWTVQVGVWAILGSAYYLLFATWAVTGYIQSNVGDQRLAQAIDYVRVAILLIVVSLFLFFVEFFPRREGPTGLQKFGRWLSERLREDGIQEKSGSSTEDNDRG